MIGKLMLVLFIILLETTINQVKKKHLVLTVGVEEGSGDYFLLREKDSCFQIQ